MSKCATDEENEPPMGLRELARTGFGPKGGVLITELTGSQCKWPLWEDASGPFHCCGAPRGKGPYCEDHSRIGSAGRVSLPKLPRGG
ncbi:GcrA family cell cycle regulator [Roseibium sp. TrichSKD4]|uniref:GcrA family cell cycle regulator n=1 Tax=Roseibium sp. TrichSKD4 TaxID=744980 RepID=UPI0009FC6E24